MPAIFHELDIKTFPEMVYLSITDENLIACWWLTGAKISPEIGSRGIFPLSKDGKEKVIVEIRELIPNQRVVWICVEHMFPDWVNTEISFEIVKTVTGNSILRFRHSGWQTESGSFGATSFTWAAQYLNNLKILLEKK